MKATLTSKGQITIPAEIRKRLGLKEGQVLEFDERAPYLKAVKAVNEHSMRAVIGVAKEPLAGRSTREWMDELRGPADIPEKDKRR